MSPVQTEKFELNGLEIISSPDENEFKERTKGTYESDSISWFLENKDDFEWFLDVGAFDGYFSLYMKQAGIKIISYEPSKEAFEMLGQNMNNNFKNGYYTFNRAVGTTNDEEITGGKGGCGFFEPRSGINVNGSESVSTITIANSLDRVDNIGSEKIALKIDTEGFELQVLQGVGDYWDNINYLMVEFHPSYVNNNEIRQTINYIVGLGFERILEDQMKDPFEDNCNIRFIKQ